MFASLGRRSPSLGGNSLAFEAHIAETLKAVEADLRLLTIHPTPRFRLSGIQNTPTT